jgi:hypothetical protein
VVPWRQRPRAASVILLSAGALIAAAAGLRGPATESSPLGAGTGVVDPSIINHTLTRDDAGCAGVRGTVWHPLSGVDYTGRLRVTLPAQLGGALVIFVGDAIRLDLEAQSATKAPVPMLHERMIAGPGVSLPPDFWLEDGSPLFAPRQISRIQIDALGTHDREVIVSLGRRAPRVLARLVGYPPTGRVQVCADAIAPGELYFATGWSGDETHEGQNVRWMRDHGVVLLSSPHGREVTVRTRLAPAVVVFGGQATELRLRINDVVDLAPIRLEHGFREYEWAVPDHAWVAGANELFFSVSQTRTSGTRRLGLALASLHVR